MKMVKHKATYTEEKLGTRRYVQLYQNIIHRILLGKTKSHMD